MNRFKYIFFVVLMAGTGLFNACDDDTELIYDPDSAILPELTSPSSSSELYYTQDEADSSVSFSWSAADPGISLEIEYSVEVCASDTFATVVDIVDETNDLEEDVSFSTINSALITLGYTADESATAYFRVVASVGDYADDMVSDIVEFDITPYETDIDYPEIYVPGEYQSWTPGDDNGILYSYDSNTIYEGILYLEDSDDDGDVEFKITSEASWSGTNWGGTLAATDDGYSGTLDESGDNLSVVPGCYKFTVDTEELTIELSETDYWGIIGTSVYPYDWSKDVDMNYNGKTKLWEISEDLVEGEFKFRANDAWTLNYGITNDDDGTLETNGSNITISAAGNYTITLDTENLEYTLTQN